jgi:hypothetical protein
MRYTASDQKILCIFNENKLTLGDTKLSGHINPITDSGHYVPPPPMQKHTSQGPCQKGLNCLKLMIKISSTYIEQILNALNKVKLQNVKS